MPSDHSPSHDPLWVSDVPRFGVVRHVVVDGDLAATFDDLNGDGREVSLTIYEREDGSWHSLAARDDVDVPAVGSPPLFGWSGALGWAVGRGRPRERLELEWEGERTVVGTDDTGWWIAVVPGDPDDDPSWRGPRVWSFTQ